MKPIKLTEKEIMKIVFQNPGTFNYYINRATAMAMKDGKTELKGDDGIKYLEVAIREKYKRYGLPIED